MKKEKKAKTKRKEKKEELEKDIDNLIDDLAYLDENKNIQKSKSFLDNMYLLNQQ